MENESRRQFLTKAAVFVAATAASSGMLGVFAREGYAAPKKAPGKKGKSKDVPLPAGAVEVPKDDPVATALGYHPDATTVNKKDNPTYKKGESCSSCALFTKQNEGWGKCQMIQSILVHSGGWCRSYNKKA